MSIKKSLTWMGATSALGQIVTWCITIIVARLLAPEDYGLVALSGLFVMFANSVSEMGVGAAVIQRKEVTHSQIRDLYSFSILIGATMTIIGIMFAPVMAIIFSDPRLTALVAVQSSVFVLSAAKSMQRNILVRETRFDVIAKVETASRIATSACTITLAVWGFGYWALAAQSILHVFFQFAVFSFVKRITPSIYIRISEIKDILFFGIQLMVRNIVGQLYALVDTAIIGKLGSKDFLGAYGFSKQLTNMPFEKVIRIVNQVLFPYFAQRQADLIAIRDLTLKIADLQAFIIAPIFYLLYFCSEEVIHILLGSKWEAAVFPLKMFCIANVFKLAESYSLNCLTALGKISGQVRYMVVLFVAIALGMITLSCLIDVESSVFVWVSVYPALSLFLSRMLLRAIGMSVRDILKRLRTIFIGHIVMIVVLATVDSLTGFTCVSSLIFKCLAGIFVYVLFMIFIDCSKIIEIVNIFFPLNRNVKQS